MAANFYFIFNFLITSPGKTSYIQDGFAKGETYWLYEMDDKHIG